MHIVTRGRIVGMGLLFAGTSAGLAQSFASVEVAGLDYAVRVPASLPTGLTAFSFKNEGKVPHEAIILRLKPGVIVDSMLKTPFPARRAMTDLAGILIAEPGQVALGRVLLDLTPGTYVLLCNFRDTPDKPPHVNLGMLSILQVK
jgi:hypothetical protein